MTTEINEDNYYKKAIDKIIQIRKEPEKVDTIDFLLHFASENPELLLHLLDKTEVPLRERIISILREGRKVQAIKLYREETRANLKEAKDFVDQIIIAERLPLPPYSYSIKV